MAQLSHEAMWEKDQGFVKGDRVFMVSDPEAWKILGVTRMQSLYGFFKQSGNVGKMKNAAGKNVINVDAVLRWKSQRPESKKGNNKKSKGGSSTSPSNKVKQKATSRGDETIMQGVFKNIDVSLKGNQERFSGVSIDLQSIEMLKASGDVLAWSRLANTYPSSFSFGTLKTVSPEIVRYISDLDLEIIDQTSGFVQDIAEKKILFVRPHEAISFVAVQLLMAADENSDTELKEFVVNVLEPAVQYLMERHEKETEEKRATFGDRLPYITQNNDGSPRNDLKTYLGLAEEPPATEEPITNEEPTTELE